MHDLGERGLHPRSLPGGKHDDGQSGTIHAAINASYDDRSPPPRRTLNPQPNPVKLTFCCLIFPDGLFWANPEGGAGDSAGGQESMHSAMPAAPLTIIFDLDGTLVDTAPDLLGALNWVLVAEGHEPVVPKDLRQIVGHGAKAMFEHALLRTGAPVAPERLASLTQRFLA